MKKLYVAGSNHMDPSWRRAFIEHFSLNDGVVRPYIDIEEEELDAYLSFAEKYGMVFGIEQTITVRSYLERNPDRRGLFEKLLREGKIEMLGGGECVIDVNLVGGESLVRNHYYSIKYLEREFGVRPTNACLADVFGVSAQIPQVLRGFGFPLVQNIARVRDNNPPIWRGLDGSLIIAGAAESSPGMPVNCIADFGKYVPCPACKGEGCDLCHGTGFDTSYTFMFDENEDNKNGATPLWKFLSKHEDAEKLLVTYFSEECFHGPDYIEYLEKLAAEHGREVIYLSYDDVFKMKDSTCDRLKRLAAGGPFKDGEIDEPVEYNPMACGCYTSRVELKKQNRELEALLVGAEAAAALALPAEKFPHKTIELLWRKLELVQFHDCITGTHTDTSYDELIRLCREVRYGAIRIRSEALNALSGKISADRSLGEPYLIFNPTGDTLSRVPLKLYMSDTKVKNPDVFDCTGKKLAVTKAEVVEGVLYNSLEVEFRGDIPALGYSVFYVKEGEGITEKQIAVPEISNEFYRVTDSAIFTSDGKPVVLSSPGALRISSDRGHAWGRQYPEDEVKDIEPKTCRAYAGKGYKKLVFEGRYLDHDMTVEKCSWTTVVTLFDGDSVIRFDNTLDWEGFDRRVSVSFPLSGKIDPKIYSGVPYGFVRRGSLKDLTSDTELGEFDEWPSTGWFAAHDTESDRSVICYTQGLCGTRLEDDRLQFSLLRAPGNKFYCVDNYGIREPGVHLASFGLEVVNGEPTAADPTGFATAFDHVRAYCAPVSEKSDESLPMRGRLLKAELDGAILSALKRDEEGNLVLRAYDPYGFGSEISGEKLIPTDFLEVEEGDASDSAKIPAFGIRTYKIK